MKREGERPRENLKKKTSLSLSLKDLNKSVFTCSDPMMIQFKKPKRCNHPPFLRSSNEENDPAVVSHARGGESVC